MYRVILTELGISVFDASNDTLMHAFPFSNPVSEYLHVKSREAKLDDLIHYINSLQRGVAVIASDESLRSILKNSHVDAQMIDDEGLEQIQTSKQQIMVDSGFASNTHDALTRLREFALGLSSSKVAEVSESPDLHIIQAINSLDEMDKIANALSSRLREWYGLHFPELDNVIDSIVGYAHIVVNAGRRQSLTKQIMEDAGFPESKVEMLTLIAGKSRGGDISDANLSIVKTMAQQILDIHQSRKELENHVVKEMNAAAPNLSAILGAAVGARILSRAGSIKRLASFPSSTIQVMGAERALFRSLKTGSRPPKHGLLFQHAMVHAAPRWQRGKIARAIAAKAVVAARVDVYGEGLNQTLLEKLNVRIDEIGKRYEHPSERENDLGRDDSRGHSGGYSRPPRQSRRNAPERRGSDDYRRRDGTGGRSKKTRMQRDETSKRYNTTKKKSGKNKKRRQFEKR